MKSRSPIRSLSSAVVALLVVSLAAFAGCSRGPLAPEDPGGVVNLDATHEYFSQFIYADEGGTIEMDPKMRFVVPAGSLESDTEIDGWVHTDAHIVEFEFYPCGTVFSPPASLELNWIVLRDLIQGNTDAAGFTAKMKPGRWKSDAPGNKTVKINFKGEGVHRIDPATIRMNGDLRPCKTQLHGGDRFFAKFSYAEAVNILQTPQSGKFSTVTITGNYYGGDRFIVTRGILIVDDGDSGSEGEDLSDDTYYDPNDVILAYFDPTIGMWVGIDAFDYDSFSGDDWLKIDVEHFSRYAVTTHNTSSGGTG